MPPSPALRYSPGRELRTSNHKRGRSFEGGLLLKEKDDDLSLFTEMQARERENFLLHSSDEFEDSFSTKLKHFSDFKHGISIPVRGQSSELLNADGDKNDYDWLLTPPDTPLFPSLDDEPLKSTAASRGRPRSQPITISRSSTMEKSHRSRGSASPSRLSPSPRSGSSMPQSRGRPVSTPHSSPTPSLRPSTPSRRSSPSPNKASTFAPRSSSPTPRRLSTGSSSTDSTSGMRGTSPIKTSRGKSASPKMRPWKSNIPGFSSNAPPNLRTSLADRPASYVRGSSPASRSSKDSASKVNRQSMSPTASRSVSSSHSHDRDRNSSYSRASVASSGEDDADSLHSISMSTSDYPSSKNVTAFSNNKVLAFSKKSGRTLSSTYAPKRSFESTIRQLDHKKTPQNMFRPLLSSVPSTTFYTGKMSSVHHSLMSRNSSVTTSSNASSDLCASLAPDAEGRGHNQEYMASECEKILYPDTHEEVFSFDKMDAVNEDYLNEISNLSLDDTQGDGSDSSGAKHGFSNFEISNKYGNNHGETTLVTKASRMEGESSEAILEEMELCSRCRRNYSTTELVEMNIKLCLECSEEERPLDVNVNIAVKITATTEQTPMSSLKISETNLSMDQIKSEVLLPESPQDTDVCDLRLSQSYETVEGDQIFCSEQKQNHLEENSPLKSVEEDGQGDSNLLETGQSMVVQSLPDSEPECPQLLPRSDSKFEMSEGTGISLLLKRSSSNKGHVVQGRTYTANIFASADLSYAKDSVSSLRSSIGHSSFSGSSSADFSSSRQTDMHMQSQSSGRKLEMENNKYEINTKSRSIGIAFSESPTEARETSHLVTKTQEAISNFSASLGLEDSSTTSEKPILASEYAESDTTCTSSGTVVEEGDLDDSYCGETVCTYTSALVSNQFDDDLAKSCPNYEDCSSYDNKEFSSNRSVSDVEVSIISPEFSLEKDSSRVDGDGFFEDGVEAPSHSLSAISETEMAINSEEIHGLQSGDNSLISKDILKENQESSAHTYSDNGDMLFDSLEPVASDSILEESTVMVECQSGSTTRSLTLEEVTDTILFCSSIVHDLAYSAATIGMEKQSEVELEGSRPTVTILGKSNSDRKEPRLRNVNKRVPKSQKPRPRRKEIEAKPPVSKTENDENTEDYVVRNVGVPDSMKPPKLESKCNCSIM